MLLQVIHITSLVSVMCLDGLMPLGGVSQVGHYLRSFTVDLIKEKIDWQFTSSCGGENCLVNFSPIKFFGYLQKYTFKVMGCFGDDPYPINRGNFHHPGRGKGEKCLQMP